MIIYAVQLKICNRANCERIEYSIFVRCWHVLLVNSGLHTFPRMVGK